MEQVRYKRLSNDSPSIQQSETAIVQQSETAIVQQSETAIVQQSETAIVQQSETTTAQQSETTTAQQSETTTAQQSETTTAQQSGTARIPAQPFQASPASQSQPLPATVPSMAVNPQVGPVVYVPTQGPSPQSVYFVNSQIRPVKPSDFLILTCVLFFLLWAFAPETLLLMVPALICSLWSRNYSRTGDLRSAKKFAMYAVVLDVCALIMAFWVAIIVSVTTMTVVLVNSFS